MQPHMKELRKKSKNVKDWSRTRYTLAKAKSQHKQRLIRKTITK